MAQIMVKPLAAAALLLLYASVAISQPLPELPADEAPAGMPLESAPAPEVDLPPLPETPARPVDPEVQRQIDALGPLYEADAAPEAGDEPASPAEDSGGTLFDVLRAVASLCMVIAVIVLLVWVLRRIGRRNPLLAGQHFGKILGRIHLAPHASLHFVKVGERVLAIGLTPQNISLLAEFHPDELELEAPEPQPEDPRAKASSFLEELRASAGDWKSEPAQQDELTELRGDLQRLQAYLRERVREPGE
jgi:flagellar protein FliO/FliZ